MKVDQMHLVKTDSNQVEITLRSGRHYSTRTFLTWDDAFRAALNGINWTWHNAADDEPRKK